MSYLWLSNAKMSNSVTYRITILTDKFFFGKESEPPAPPSHLPAQVLFTNKCKKPKYRYILSFNIIKLSRIKNYIRIKSRIRIKTGRMPTL